MSVAANDPRPPRVQVADTLRAEISSGEKSAGQKLGSIRDLATRFNVAQMTVSGALRILVEEGRIFSVPNRGYFVGSPDEPTEAEAPEAPSLRDEINTIHSEMRELAARVAELEKRADHVGSADV
jgi:GntR family transcriptional regulator